MENRCVELRKINNKLEDSNLELLHRVEMLELSGKKIHNQSSPPLSASLSSSGNLSLSGKYFVFTTVLSALFIIKLY